MTSLLILVPVALLLLGLAIWAFAWAVEHRQFDDLDEQAQRILFDDAPPGSGGPDLRDDPPRSASEDAA